MKVAALASPPIIPRPVRRAMRAGVDAALCLVILALLCVDEIWEHLERLVRGVRA